MTLLMNKWTNIVMDDGWAHPLAKTIPSHVNNLFDLNFKYTFENASRDAFKNNQNFL